MEAVCSKVYRAPGSITVNGIAITKTSFGNTIEAAMKRVLKGLSNMSRARLGGTEGWTEWRDLPPVAQNKWLDKVAETLQWQELKGGKVATLHSVSVGEFSRALVRSLA